MTIEHDLSDKQRKVLQSIAAKATDDFAKSVAIFMRECLRHGMEPRIGGAAFSSFAITNAAKVLAICSGIPPEELDKDAIRDIAEESHFHLVENVSAYIEKGNDKFRAEMN